MSGIDMLEVFELQFKDNVGLARRLLANVPDNYSEVQLNDIGTRALFWVLKAYREFLQRDTTPVIVSGH